jgi:hypothetical protein
MMALVSKGFRAFREGAIPTFLDSGASDTMFVTRDAFLTYQVTTPRSGDSAKAIDRDFEIIREGTMVKKYLICGKARTITYTRALHTPTLNTNLISVSAFDQAGLATTFAGRCGTVRRKDGGIILTGKCEKGMYIVDEIEDPPNAHSRATVMTSLSQAVPLSQWHRRLAHCSLL